jgi:anti-sigma B factor antagonist
LVSIASEIGDITLLTLKGKLVSLEDVEAMHHAIREALNNNRKKIILDLKNVNWISSLGVGAIMRSMTTAKNNGGDLRLASVSNKIRNIFSITKLDTIFNIYSSLEDAVQNYK